MEKIMSVEDRIKRAEERYYRTRVDENTIKNERINELRRNISKDNSKKEIKLFQKIVKQIILCLLIYGGFYLIVNNNYIFSKDFTDKAKEILEQDINFVEVYNFIKSRANEFYQKVNNEENLQNNDVNIGGAIEDESMQDMNVLNTENNTENNIEDNINPTDIVEQTSENLEANQENNEENLKVEQNINNLSQMEQDANFVKSTVNFIKPINGEITSRFGPRNPTTPTVPKNHKGTDIASVIGTKIISATDGTVVLASSQGDYGNHLKIQIGEILIVYAHCNKLYVKQGDNIRQGQEIAEVGDTGNVTGPHLHFEVRYQGRYIDPEMILEL